MISGNRITGDIFLLLHWGRENEGSTGTWIDLHVFDISGAWLALMPMLRWSGRVEMDKHVNEQKSYQAIRCFITLWGSCDHFILCVVDFQVNTEMTSPTVNWKESACICVANMMLCWMMSHHWSGFSIFIQLQMQRPHYEWNEHSEIWIWTWPQSAGGTFHCNLFVSWVFLFLNPGF